MQTANDDEKDVYNGDLGVITGIDPDAGEVTITFDGRVPALAYACCPYSRILNLRAVALAVRAAQTAAVAADVGAASRPARPHLPRSDPIGGRVMVTSTTPTSSGLDLRVKPRAAHMASMVVFSRSTSP